MGREIESKLKHVVKEAMKDVKSHNGYDVHIPHLILTTLMDGNNKAIDVLEAMRVDVRALYDSLYDETYTKDMVPRPYEAKDITFSKEVKVIFDSLEEEAEMLDDENIDTIHLFLAILKSGAPINKVFKAFGITYNEFKETVITKNRFEEVPDDSDSTPPRRPNRPKRPTNPALENNTPILNLYCRDVTAAVNRGEVDPVVGREKEIKRVSQILSRRKKNNPVLIGEPGVGKTSIVEGLAAMIERKEAPRVIANKRIFSLNLASLVAGTKYRGQFEERIKGMMDELKDNRDVILFIDELHTMVGAGNASGSLDASNIFKPALANGELQIIGATTLDEFRENIEKDGALTRRFQQVLIKEPSLEETIIILKNIKDKYEEHHKVTYTDEAIEECVKMSDRYITDRAMPDKAIDVMDEAGAATNLVQAKPERILKLEEAKAKVVAEKEIVVNRQLFEEAARLRDEGAKINKQLEKAKDDWERELDTKRTEVGVGEIREVVSNMTGIPLHKVSSQENKRLLNMHNVLKECIIGQDDAIDKVTRAIKRNRLGIKDKKKPIGTFIFLGPTGVGKTELAKQLAVQMFGDDDALIRMDMSEYMEKFAVSRLVGAPPGYVGYEEGGQLTEKVRRRPYSVVLFDEIEKAHPDVFNLLLQLLDEGVLTDTLGRKVDFKNCLIILTSNVGVKQLAAFGEGVGFKTNSSIANKDAKHKAILESSLKKKFAPEFLNRIDDTIIFNSLTKEDIVRIMKIELNDVKGWIADAGYDIKLDKSAIDFLVTEGYHEEYGARPLERAIKTHVGDLITDAMLTETLKPEDTIKISYDKKLGQLVIKP